VRQLIVHCGLLLAIAACSSGASSPQSGSQPSASAAATGASIGTSGGSSSGSGGGSTSGGSRTSDFATGGQVQAPTTLSGDLAFDPSFSGEFYGSLPDGGPDLSNLDCRISDGTDLGQLCSPPRPLGSDGGPTIARQILDIYVTSLSGAALNEGTAEVSLPFAADGGVFATIELTLCSDGGWDFERALSGQVTYQVSMQGMSGEFQALFPGYADGGGSLEGTFGAAYCGSLNSMP